MTTNTTTAIPFGTALVGQTEKAFNAILGRELAGTGLTEPLWVALTLTSMSGGTLEPAALQARMAGTQKTDLETAKGRIADLETLGLVHTTEAGTVALTAHGADVWGGIRATIGEITAGIWGDLPEEDLAVAARVLNTVLVRANAVLAG